MSDYTKCESGALARIRAGVAQCCDKLLHDFCQVTELLRALNTRDDYVAQMIANYNNIAETVGNLVSSLYNGEDMYVVDELMGLIQSYGSMADMIGEL